MIPQAIARILPATLALIRETAGEAVDLREIWKGLGLNIDAPGRNAINRWTKELMGQGVAYKDAIDYYHAAKYWVGQAAFLAKAPPTRELDPRLARHIPLKGHLVRDYATFRTNVEVTVTDPATGESRAYYRWISTETSPAPADVMQEAVDAVEIDVGLSPTVGGRTDLAGLVVQTRITDFGVYMD